jgi:hypothetical protein
MLRFFWDEAVALDPAVEPKDERHMKLSRQGQLGDLWRQAGFINIEEKPLVIDQTYSSFNDYWDPFTKGAGPGLATSVICTLTMRSSERYAGISLRTNAQIGIGYARLGARCPPKAKVRGSNPLGRASICDQ